MGRESPDLQAEVLRASEQHLVGENKQLATTQHRKGFEIRWRLRGGRWRLSEGTVP